MKEFKVALAMAMMDVIGLALKLLLTLLLKQQCTPLGSK